MSALDALINGGPDSDDAFYRHCEAHFKPLPVPIAAYDLNAVEAAQACFAVRPSDRESLVFNYGIDVLAASPTIVEQRRQPN